MASLVFSRIAILQWPDHGIRSLVCRGVEYRHRFVDVGSYGGWALLGFPSDKFRRDARQFTATRCSSGPSLSGCTSGFHSDVGQIDARISGTPKRSIPPRDGFDVGFFARIVVNQPFAFRFVSVAGGLRGWFRGLPGSFRQQSSIVSVGVQEGLRCSGRLSSLETSCDRRMTQG